MGEVSRELVWLRWFRIGQQHLPSGLSLKKLRVLELYEEEWTDEHHLQELWRESDGEAPVQLRRLLISCCRKFQGFPKSIGHLDHLKQIIIKWGDNVTSLPDEFCLLQSLEHLVLIGSKMPSLPSKFGNLTNLQHLDLSSCDVLRRLPVSFKNLRLLEHLNLHRCNQLTFESEDLDCLQNITKLEFLDLRECKQLKELPRHITNQASLRKLYFSYNSLRELPDNIGQLCRLRKMSIKGVLLTRLPNSFGSLSSLTRLKIRKCRKLERLSDSLGGLSSLTNLEIEDCPKLECLPDDLADLSSLTNLDIRDCPKLQGVNSLQKAARQLSSLQDLRISKCPIGEASLSFGSSNLRDIVLKKTEVRKISFSEGCSPHLKSLYISKNHHLEEIEALPRTLETIYLKNCEMLEKIASFAGLTSLRIFRQTGWNRIEKIEGIENCKGLEGLTVDSRLEVPGIESLENLHNLKKLELTAKKRSVIERCIQRIQKWPPVTRICARAVPEAASRVDSLLSQNLVIVDSISNKKIKPIMTCGGAWKAGKIKPKMVWGGSSNADAIMLCFIMNCVSSQMTLQMITGARGTTRYFGETKVEKGRWAWVGVFTQHFKYYLRSEVDVGEEDEVEKSWISYYLNSKGEVGEEDEAEKVLVVRGEEQTLMEAAGRLLPLLLES